MFCYITVAIFVIPEDFKRELGLLGRSNNMPTNIEELAYQAFDECL